MKMPYSTTRTLCILFVVAFFLLATQTSLGQQPAPRITGTYSNMYYNKEGGDVLGDEIKIVATEKGYQGVLQMAEGAPGDLTVVEIKVEGAKISFLIPDSSEYAGKFAGVIEQGKLRGEFTFKNGATKKVELRRGKSYWD